MRSRCTDRPMKGMLTGPVTMLQWSFVRDDIAAVTVCRQIALAHPRRGRRPGGGRHRRDPGRRAGVPRGPAAAAGRLGRPIWTGRWRASGWPPAACGMTPASTPTCATRSSTTSCRRSRRWTPTRSRSKPRAAGWNCWTPSRRAGGTRLSRPRSARASGTSTARAMPGHRGDGRIAGPGARAAAGLADLGQPGLRPEDPQAGRRSGRRWRTLLRRHARCVRVRRPALPQPDRSRSSAIRLKFAVWSCQRVGRNTVGGPRASHATGSRRSCPRQPGEPDSIIIPGRSRSPTRRASMPG